MRHAVPMRAEGRGGVPPDLDNAGSRHHDSMETLARLARFRLQEPTGWAAAGREDGGAEKRQGDASVFEPRVSAETFVLSFLLLLTGDMRAAASPLFWGCFVADRNKQPTRQKVPRPVHIALSIIPLISLRGRCSAVSDPWMDRPETCSS